MAGPTSYRDWLVNYLAPPWLRGAWGAALLGVCGDAFDRIGTAARDAIKATRPAQAPADALPWIGAGRALERFSGDSDASYRARLGDPWTQWEFAGTKARLLANLALQGCTAAVYAWRDLSSAPPPFAAWWSAFWLHITGSPWTSEGAWGDGHAPWGDGGTWGSSATSDEVAAVRTMVRKWKSATEINAGTVLVFSGDVWGPGGTFANGSWGGATATWAG